MSVVNVDGNEPFDKALKRFKKKCNKEGIMKRIKETKYYEKPSDRKRRKLRKSMSKSSSGGYVS